MSIHRRIILIALVMVLMSLVGIVISFRVANYVRNNEQAVWLANAKSETTRLTEQILSEIHKAKLNLRAMSERFRADNVIQTDHFRALTKEFQSWGPDTQLEIIAFAERVGRSERDAYEELHGEALKSVGTPEKNAPPVAENFVVRVVSPLNDLVRPNSDLATHPVMAATIQTAIYLPKNVILGPSLVGDSNRRLIPIAITANLENLSGIIIGMFDLDKFISGTIEGYPLHGLGLRLIERNTEAGDNVQRAALIGEFSAPEGSITNVIRLTSGMAQWALHWDISKTYLGGPRTNFETIARIGGSTISILVPAILFFLITLSQRFHLQVQEKTSELSHNAMIIQLTMDTINQGFAVWNSDNRIVVWSKRCLDFWYHPGEWLVSGLHMKKLLAHIAKHGAFGPGDIETTAEREFNRIVSAGSNSDERFQMADGTHVHVRRFPLEHGGHVAVYTDTSLQVRAMAQLEQARDEMEEKVKSRTHDLLFAKDRAEQANRAKTALLANVSHELRTPLNGIIGFSDMISMGIGNTTNEYAGHIKTAGEHLLSVVCDLLDISRIEAGIVEIEFQETKVHDVIGEVLEVVEHAAATLDVHFKVVVSDDLPVLHVDKSRLKQILINLLDNAVKFSNVGSQVSIFASTDMFGDMVIRIVDDGIGISQQDLPRILEPFGQVQGVMARTHGGLGLGVPLAKTLTELMNGKFQVESGPGEGTSVTLTFPRAQVGNPDNWESVPPTESLPETAK